MAENLTQVQRSAIMRAIRSKDTVPERIVRSTLHRMGFRFRLHRKDLPGKPDIVLPYWKCAILVNGCFWHGHDCGHVGLPTSNRDYWEKKIAKNQARDQQVCTELLSAGWRVLTIWECEIRDTGALHLRLSQISNERAESESSDSGGI